MPIQQPSITPMLFASGPRRLMGVLHAAAKGSRRGVGVLICNQVGPDYGEYYKTGRMLIGMLVAKSFDCLRFDYTGCGDSEGGCQDASVQQWLIDTASALHLLKEQSGCSTVCLCGFGFGGLLAAAYAARSPDVESLLLWDPVVDGATYCRQLRKRHRQWLRGSFVKAERGDKQFQAMGFAATPDLEEEMGQLKLEGLACCHARRVFTVTQDGSADQGLLETHFGRQGLGVQSCSMPPDALPLRPMRAATAWLGGNVARG